MRHRGSRQRRRAASVVPSVAALALTALVATWPSPASAAPDLQVEVGVQGFYDLGDHVVVKATVSADQLVQGAVEVRTRPGGGGTVAVRRDVDLAGGTAKDVYLVVPTSPFEPAVLEVSVLDGDRRVATTTVQPSTQADVELVGVLPGLAGAAGQLPGSTALRLDAGTARLAALPPEVLDLGPAALEAYDTIAGLSGDLSALAPAAQATLAQWVERGGRLLLDDDAEPTALPPEWRPGPAGYVAAGGGEVRRSGGRAAAGAWDEVLQPGPVSAIAEAGSFNRRQLEQLLPQGATLARDAGLRTPGLGTTLALLGGYVVLVGPVVYLVLRRRRRLTAAWVVIPAIALLVAGIVVVGGGRLRSTASPRAATVISIGPAGSWAETGLLVLGGGGGTRQADLPAGWWLDAGDDGWATGSATTALRQDLDGMQSVVSARLAPGEAQVLGAAGPLPDQPGLTLTAAADGDEPGTVRGTVRNDGPVALDEVAVFAGNGAANVGLLQPGQEAPYVITGADRFEDQPLVPQVWGASGLGFGFAPAETSDVVDIGLWSTFSSRNGTGFRQSGVARAAGWSREIDQPLHVGGRPVEGRVAVTSLATIRPEEGPLPALAVRQELVRGPGFEGPAAGENEQTGVLRFLLPPGTPAGTPLAIDLPSWIASTAVWVDGAGWADVGPVDPAQDRLVAVPAGAVLDGAVFLRFGVRFDRALQGPDLMLRGLAPGEVAG